MSCNRHLPVIFPTKFCTKFWSSMRATSPGHLIPNDLIILINKDEEYKMMKFLIMQASPTCYLHPLRPKHYSLQPILRHPQSVSITRFVKPSLNTILNQLNPVRRFIPCLCRIRLILSFLLRPRAQVPTSLQVSSDLSPTTHELHVTSTSFLF
jgi:hypothetical protein